MQKLKKYHGPAVLDVGQAVVQFTGTPQAAIFGYLVNVSLVGRIKGNLVRIATANKLPGFVHASPRGHPWHLAPLAIKYM